MPTRRTVGDLLILVLLFCVVVAVLVLCAHLSTDAPRRIDFTSEVF
jgi:hypothetical protein